MVTDKIKKLREYQRQMAKIEKELSRFNSKLAALPAKYGFKSMDAFIDALRAAKTGTPAKAGAKAAASGGRKPRAVITPEMKQKLKAMVNDGKTGGQIAKALNISLPSVQNIKKELGLVKARK
jgi:DNA-binding NarL/FixJ family response regulator